MVVPSIANLNLVLYQRMHAQYTGEQKNSTDIQGWPCERLGAACGVQPGVSSHAKLHHVYARCTPETQRKCTYNLHIELCNTYPTDAGTPSVFLDERRVLPIDRGRGELTENAKLHSIDLRESVDLNVAAPGFIVPHIVEVQVPVHLDELATAQQ